MHDYQVRVVEEKAALDTKLSALGKFLDKNTNNTQIPRDEWSRLSTQMHLMCSYSAILGARIAAFEP